MQPTLGNKIIHRMGYGAMRLPGIRGTAENPDLALALLREAVKLGANLIDTAGFYGAGLANCLIAEALAPYSENLIISTKVGVKTGESGRPEPATTATEIKASVEDNLNSLQMSSLDLVFLRLPGGPLADSGVPMQEQLQCLAALQAEGVIKHIGLSSTTVEQLETACQIINVDAVQNALFVRNDGSLNVVQFCHEKNIPFLAYFPLGMGSLIEKKVDLEPWAIAHQASKAQIALAWLLSLSPMVIPIPGTSNITHLRENFAAINIVLSQSDIDALSETAHNKENEL